MRQMTHHRLHQKNDVADSTFESFMPTHKKLHPFEAKSADTRISRDQPTVARLNFSLANGDVLVVEVPRYVLERLLVRAKRAIESSTSCRARAFNRPLGGRQEVIDMASKYDSPTGWYRELQPGEKRTFWVFRRLDTRLHYECANFRHQGVVKPSKASTSGAALHC
jgi:hypothetical protein